MSRTFSTMWLLSMKSLLAIFRSDVGAGLLLMIAAIAAMVLANSPLSEVYHGILDTRFGVGLGSYSLEKSVLLWINDGLMAVFFLLVGLEIKRELIEGELSDRRRAALPIIGAIGGMLGPIIIYAVINRDSPATLVGWPIPAATDIAFALGVLSLVKRHVAPGLRVFLLGLAIIDDLGAIVAAMCVAVLALLNRLKVKNLALYLIVGVILWLSVLKSGVHATLAGVVIGTMIPRKSMHKLEHALHPWVIFGLMPIFALANAGASLDGVGLHTFTEPVALGIILGLFLGKQLGVSLFCWIAVKTGLAKLPSGSSWMTLHGVAIVTGIGFTMSLFVGSLAFTDGTFDTAVRLGVLTGSALSAVVGCTWLVLCRTPRSAS